MIQKVDEKRERRAIIFFLFLITTVLLFRFFHLEQLVYREQLQLFQVGLKSIFEKFSIPGGISIYLGEFFVQFFKFKTGALVVIVGSLGILLYFSYNVFSRIVNKNIALLFSLIPSIGYSLLFLNNFFYFSGIIAFIFSIVSIGIYIRIDDIKKRRLVAFLLIPVIYWIAGGAVFVFSLSAFLYEVLMDNESSDIEKWLFSLIYLLLSILIPLVVRYTVFYGNWLQSFVSKAFYRVPIFFPLKLILTLLSIPFLVFLSVLFSKQNISYSVKKTNLMGTVLIIVYAIIFYSFSNKEEEVIRKFDNFVYQEKWDDIIKLAMEKSLPKSDEVSLAVNLALAKEGRLTSDFFKIKGLQPIFVIPYKRQGMAPFLASDPYFYLGLNNFARMMAMETLESTVDAKLPVRAVKRVAETFLIDENILNSKKYLNLLRHTLFYSSWANRYLKAISEGNFSHKVLSPDLEEIRTRLPKEHFFYNEMEFPVSLLYLLRANNENIMAYEYLMLHYLLEKNFDSFIKFLLVYPSFHYCESPLVFQEAKAYIQTLTSERLPSLDVIEISENVQESFQKYIYEYINGGKENPSRMKNLFGDTYWYYLHFSDYKSE